MRILIIYITLIVTAGLSAPILVEAGEIYDLEIQIGEREKEIQDLQEKAQEYKGVINQSQEEAKTLSNAVVNFNNQIDEVENSITIKQTEISALTLNIRRVGLEIQAKEESIKRTKQYISALLREVYAGDDRGIVELILKYDNFSEFFNQVEYRNLLQEDLKIRLEEIVGLKLKLEADKKDLDAKKEELTELKRGLEDKNAILSYQKEQKQGLLRDTRNTEWRYKNLLKETEDREFNIRQEIFELEEQLRRTLDPSSIPRAAPGVLAWPTEGLLTQEYGCLETKFARGAYPACNGGAGGFHNAIDIASGLGTPIVAARNGTVRAINNSPFAYGKWVAIEHDNGLVTVYTHLSLRSVTAGQNIKRGELVGYMGKTGFTTGPHIHFMVYVPNTFSTKPSKYTYGGILPIGLPLNPLDYLP